MSGEDGQHTKSRRKTATFVVVGLIVAALPVLVVGGLFGWLAYDAWASAPAAAAAEARAVDEFQAIHVRPGDQTLSSHASYKTHHGLAGATYGSSVKYEVLRQYYDTELASRGWAYCGEREVRDWGKDLGGKEAFYRLGDDTVTLEYAGDRAGYGWSYALDVSWGLHTNCGD